MDTKLEECIEKELAKKPFAFLEMYDCFSEEYCIDKVPFKMDDFMQGYWCRLSPLYQKNYNELKENYDGEE